MGRPPKKAVAGRLLNLKRGERLETRERTHARASHLVPPDDKNIVWEDMATLSYIP